MCSISGWISDKPLSPTDRLRLACGLLFYGEIRGSHSAGIKLGHRLVKKALDPMKFIRTDEFADVFTENDGLICLAHTRAPTSGGRGDKDAQPFVSGGAATVHNGMIHNCPELIKKFDLQKADSQVDSSLYAAFVDRYGAAMLPEFIAETFGPSAVAAEDPTGLYLVRAGNPISLISIVTPDKIKVTVWASTYSILADALRYTWLWPNNLKPQDLPERQLFSVSPDGVTKIGDKFKHGYEPLGYAGPVHVQHGRGRSYVQDDFDWDGDGFQSRWEDRWHKDETTGTFRLRTMKEQRAYMKELRAKDKKIEEAYFEKKAEEKLLAEKAEKKETNDAPVDRTNS